MKQQNESLFLFFMVLAMFLWGASWVSGKLVTGEPVVFDLIVFWRMLICFAGFAAFYPFRRFNLRLSPGQFVPVIINGLLMVLYNYLFFTGISRGLAGKAGVIVTSLAPVITFILGSVFFRFAIKSIQVAGILLGLLGGVLLLEPWAISMSELYSSSFILLLAAFIWALITLISGKAMEKGVGPFSYNFYFYLTASLTSTMLSLDSHPFDFSQYSTGFWLNILFLAIFATIGATSIYFFATSRIGSARTSSFLLLVPAFALILSWMVLGEVPRVFTLLGGAVAVSAVYLINSAKTGSR